METKQFDSSREELEKAHSLGSGPEASKARLYLANLFIRQGDFKSAVEQSELYLKEVPKVANADEVRERVAQMRTISEKGQGQRPQGAVTPP
jgi:hypothetical protein